MASSKVRLLVWFWIAGLVCSTPGYATQDIAENYFSSQVRPALIGLGCASSACHGSGLVPMKLSVGELPDEAVRAEFFEVSPLRTKLLDKALGRNHLGGKIIETSSCWSTIFKNFSTGKFINLECQSKARSQSTGGSKSDLFVQCQSCHSEEKVSEWFRAARFSSWNSEIHTVLKGDGNHEKKIGVEPNDANWSHYFLEINGETSSKSLALGLSFKEFVGVIQPILFNRGCATSGCHGNSTQAFRMMQSQSYSEDNFLRVALAYRQGTFPDKPLNVLPHGGGSRLSDPKKDCPSAQILAWLDGKKTVNCARVSKPSLESFTNIVQPGLEELTCHRCHTTGLGGFTFTKTRNNDEIKHNYRQVLKHIDLSYSYNSGILLRAKEPCLYTKILAWVEGKEAPTCTVKLENLTGKFPGE